MRLPAPQELVVSVRGAARYALDSALFLALLPVRVAALLAQVEALLAKIDRVVDEASATAADAQRVALGAGQVVLQANQTSIAAQELLALYEPAARQAAPMVSRFVNQFESDELEAAIRMVDQLPALTRSMIDDVMPVLETLDTVGPDIHNLLATAQDVREAVVGIPGFTFFRKRGGEKIDPSQHPTWGEQ